jgi:ankyrin repeat protein
MSQTGNKMRTLFTNNDISRDAASRDEKITLWLLEHGADPNRQCSIDFTPLSLAAQFGTVHTIKVMLDDYDGDVQRGQLLHYAVRRKTDVVDVLELLLDRGAPINQTMYEKHDWSRRFHFWMPLGTALHEAGRVDNVKAARYLLSRGIDASIKDTKGDTALEWARRCNSAKVVRLLEEVEDTAKDSNGEGQEVPARPSNYCSIM